MSGGLKWQYVVNYKLLVFVFTLKLIGLPSVNFECHHLYHCDVPRGHRSISQDVILCSLNSRPFKKHYLFGLHCSHYEYFTASPLCGHSQKF